MVSRKLEIRCGMVLGFPSILSSWVTARRTVSAWVGFAPVQAVELIRRLGQRLLLLREAGDQAGDLLSRDRNRGIYPARCRSP